MLLSLKKQIKIMKKSEQLLQRQTKNGIIYHWRVMAVGGVLQRFAYAYFAAAIAVSSRAITAK